MKFFLPMTIHPLPSSHHDLFRRAEHHVLQAHYYAEKEKEFGLAQMLYAEAARIYKRVGDKEKANVCEKAGDLCRKLSKR